MKKVCLFFVSLITLSLIQISHFDNSAIAFYMEGGYSDYYHTEIHFFDSNSGTSWGVRAKYDAHPRSYSVGWASYYWSDDSDADIVIGNYGPDSQDTVTWFTACVDPETPVSANYNTERDAYIDYISVTCDSSKTSTVKYRGCGSPNNHGYVGWSAVCPANTSNSCVEAGIVWNCPDRCDGCTLSRRDCDYSAAGAGDCKITSTLPNSSDCGGSCGVSTPATPNVTADPNCNNTNPRVSLDWAAAARATSYDVEYKRDSASSWTVGANNTTNTSYNITGITEGVLYDWRVRSVNSGGSSAWDTGTTRSPTCSVAPPNCPSTITATSNCNTGNNAYVDIDWSAVSGASDYDVRWKPSSSTSWNGPYNTAASDYRISASSINNNTDYDYQVRANNSGGSSGWCPSTARTIRSDTCTVPPTTAPNTRDLILQTFTFPGGPEGSTVDPTVIIRNQGNTDVTGDFDVRVQAQQNGNGHNLTRRVTATVEAGTNEDVSSLFSNMLLGTAGNKTALATVDYNTEINESNEGNNTATDPYTITPPDSYDIDVNVFDDPSGNCSGNTRIGGSRVCIGAECQNTSASNPGAKFSNLSAGTYNINLTPRNGYILSTCSSNPKTRDVPPNATANYYIQQPPPSCTLATSRGSVNPGQNATLTGTAPSGVDYIWQTPGPGSYPGSAPYNTGATNTVTWRSPNPYYIDDYAYPSLQVCWSGTSNCSACPITTGGDPGSNPSGQGIHIIPTFNISGNVFVDIDGNQRMQSESAYTSSVTIRVCQGSSCNNYNSANGTYNITGLTQGNYSVSYTTVPSGYTVTYPLNGPPPSFNVSLGSPCSENSLDATCSNGSVSGLNFGITNVSSWIQAEGSDIRAFSGAFNNQIPPAPNCGGVTDIYTNRNNTSVANGTPGLVFSSGSQDHDSGQASSRNWQVTGVGYDCSNSKTTYGYIKNVVKNNGITPTTLPGCSTSGVDINCNTSSWGNIANSQVKVFEVTPGTNGTVNINGSGYDFPVGHDFVILVNGKLKINEDIRVPSGSTAIFAASDDLTIASSVGSSATSTTANLEGWYTTQGSLILENTNSCPTPSSRLNVRGAMVACGGFTNQRNLCGQNANCPSFYIKERVDFILNAPEFLMPTRRVWQEVAP